MNGSWNPGRVLQSLTIRAKLVLLVGTALGLLLLAASSGYWGMERVRSALDEITQTRMVSVMHLQTMHEAKMAIQAIQASVFMYETDSEAQGKFAQLAARNHEVWKRIDKAVEAYQKLVLNTEERARWATAAGDLHIGRENDQKLMEIVRRMAANHDREEQEGLFQEYYLAYSVAAPLFLKIESSVQAILNKSVASAEAASHSASDASERASLALIGITGVIATVNDISTTLSGQRQANLQVAESVEQIAQMSRTNGGAIHECAESASRLKDLACELRSAVDKFQQS